MNPATSTFSQHLAPNPASCYKQLFVKGSRIRARVLYGMFMCAEEPMTAEEIACDLDLPLAAVEEAIDYCLGNPPEIAEDTAREERLMEASGMAVPGSRQCSSFKIVPPETVARILKS